MLQRYARERQAEAQEKARLEEEWRRAKYCHAQNEVWTCQPDARPVGERFGQEEVVGEARAEARVTSAERDKAMERRGAAKAALESLRSRHGMPVTHFDWHLWMEANEDAFRGLMKTAPTARRAKSFRLQARDDLPPPTRRIYPQAVRYAPSAPWAKLLWLRDGWHAVRASGKAHVVFLHRLRGTTMVMLMSAFMMPDSPGCWRLPKGLSFLGHMLPFPDFEEEHLEASVEMVVELEVSGDVDADGVVCRVTRSRRLVEPLKNIPRSSAGEEVEMSDESDMEKDVGSSCDSAISADTDKESSVSEESGASSQGEEEGGEENAPPEAPEVGAAASRVMRPPLWTNEYFYISDNQGYADVKVRMHSRWSTEAHMGHWAMSKTLTPENFGETRESPVRSMCLLRAWTLWRSSQNGWADQRPGRARQFQRDAEALENDIRALPGELLGNAAADARLREWAPDVVARLSV